MSPKINTIEFKRLVKKSQLPLPQIATLLKREYQTVRAYSCGARRVPREIVEVMQAAFD